MSRKQKVQWMWDVVLRTNFKLSEVMKGSTGDLVIRGYYSDVEATVSYQHNLDLSFSFVCVTVRHGGVIHSVIHGKLYEKVLIDVFHAVQSGEGRLWWLKEGGMVECFVEAIKEMVS